MREMLMEVLFGMIAVESLVQLWFEAAPLQPIRAFLIRWTPFLESEEKGHLFDCKYCTSFWAGLIVTIWLFYLPGFWFMASVLVFHRLSNFLHLLFSIIRDMQIDMRVARNGLRLDKPGG